MFLIFHQPGGIFIILLLIFRLYYIIFGLIQIWSIFISNDISIMIYSVDIPNDPNRYNDAELVRYQELTDISRLELFYGERAIEEAERIKTNGQVPSIEKIEAIEQNVYKARGNLETAADAMDRLHVFKTSREGANADTSFETSEMPRYMELTDKNDQIVQYCRDVRNSGN